MIATQGVKAFVDGLLNSEEYQANFGDSVVPYQRSRILPSREQGNLPFARMARYDRSDRPELVTNPVGVLYIPTVDMAELGNIGQGIFVAAVVLLVAVSILLVAASAASL